MLCMFICIIEIKPRMTMTEYRIELMLPNALLLSEMKIGKV